MLKKIARVYGAATSRQKRRELKFMLGVEILGLVEDGGAGIESICW